MRHTALFLVVLAISGHAAAETVYVTDNLRLGLHQQPDTSDRAFRTLESGQALEILNRDRNYANVQLPDGVVGYVKAAYLVDEKPAKLIVNETLAEVDRLKAELADLKNAFAAPSATIAGLEQQLLKHNADLKASNATLAELQQENDKYKSRHDQFKFSLPITWVAGAMALCLIFGVLFGFWWVDQRNRKKHGGIRVY